MKTQQITTYTFDELSEPAKQRARDWFRESSCGDNFWSECTLEEAEREGQLLGIDFARTDRNEARIYWSGFWSQGDGACFEGTWSASNVKAEKVAEGWGDDPATKEIKRIAGVFAEIAREYPQAYFRVTHRGHYQHENCTVFDVCMVKERAAEDALIENARDFMRWIYRQLEKEWEYQNADAQVDENIRANEYEFTAEGCRTIAL